MISTNKCRVGIEVKFSINESSHRKRLLGQIDEYLKHCDALIVVIYKPVDKEIVRIIEEKEKEKGKIIRVLAPNLC
ncbi:hypothetical protein DRN72_02620 [Methanosarcinales archaeon]|nr:MAG: hypothetical protein DRN72_02620 [Methanosarcinales archaeon]